MISFKMSLGIFLFVGSLSFIVAKIAVEPGQLQTLEHPDKNEYRAAIPHSDKHKFGYELSENRHFHHTTTDEDGVRLGCYGHVLEGKKYSTQYVADMKGYRPVHTHDLISVYPKSGGERKASFVREFSEDEIRSQNIRFFFPDACKAKEKIITEESRRVEINVPPPQTTQRSTTTTTTTTERTTTADPTCPKAECVCTCS